VRGRLVHGAVLVIAHRGASGTRPENTLVAFRRAEELGAQMVELDVQLSRDGEVIVLHDWTLDRTSDGRGRVGKRTIEELRRLDAGTWFDRAYAGERIPTLGEVLAAIRIRIDGAPRKSLDDVLRAAGTLKGKRSLDDPPPPPVKASFEDALKKASTKKDWPGL